MPHLSLIPSQKAIHRRLAGFHSGDTLKLFFKPGERLDAVLERFNEYRSPENQILELFMSPDLTRSYPMRSVLNSDLSLWVA